MENIHKSQSYVTDSPIGMPKIPVRGAWTVAVAYITWIWSLCMPPLHVI